MYINPNLGNEIGHATRFQKGNKGGPGRRKGSVNIKQAIIRMLRRVEEARDPFDEKMKRLPLADWVILSLIGKALTGDVHAARELFDRAEGKAMQRTELSGPNGSPLQINHAAHLDAVYTQMNATFGIEVEEIKELE